MFHLRRAHSEVGSDVAGSVWLMRSAVGCDLTVAPGPCEDVADPYLLTAAEPGVLPRALVIQSEMVWLWLWHSRVTAVPSGSTADGLANECSRGPLDHAQT